MIRVGNRDCRLYYNTATHAEPDWIEIKRAHGVAVDPDALDKKELTVRGSRGFKTYEPGLQDLGLKFTIPTDEEDAVFVALETAYLNRYALEVAVMDGDMETAKSRGWTMTVKIFKFQRKEGDADIVEQDVEMAPCISENPPEYIAVTES